MQPFRRRDGVSLFCNVATDRNDNMFAELRSDARDRNPGFQYRISDFKEDFKFLEFRCEYNYYAVMRL